VGAVFPKDVLAKLRVGKGDMLYITETPDGVMLRPFNADFADKMAIAEDIMREDRDVLRKLAE
jgi:putative addiction module antidote